MPDHSGDFLTPRHTPAPLPQQHHQQQQQQQRYQPRQQTPVLPVRGPGLQYDTNNVPTAPSSPVVLNGPIPPNFIPQTLTNSRGVSTPISRSAGLPGMGTHSGMSTPVIPGNPPPVFPTTAPPAGTLYGNPLAKNRDREEQSQQQPPPASPAWNNKPFASGGASPAWANKPFGTPGGGGGGAPPSPSWGASSPAAWGTNNAFGAPGVSGSASGGGGGGGVSSPRGWGGANQPFIPPGVSNSAGGMTPSTAARNLPGYAGSGTGSLVGRSGVPLYGPPLSSGTPVPIPASLPSGFGAPSSPMMMPAPTVPTYGDDEDDGADGFDPTTEENTRLNAAVGMSVVDVPTSSSAPTKKKKKKR